jgi:hypothetical protein
MIRGTIQKRANFDIKQLSPIKGAPKCSTPEGALPVYAMP